MAKRMITTEFTQEDEKIETGLRPQYLIDYIGQKKVKDNLKVYIEAAKQRQESLDHVLLYGPPGLGNINLAIADDCCRSGHPDSIFIFIIIQIQISAKQMDCDLMIGKII